MGEENGDSVGAGELEKNLDHINKTETEVTVITEDPLRDSVLKIRNNDSSLISAGALNQSRQSSTLLSSSLSGNKARFTKITTDNNDSEI